MPPSTATFLFVAYIVWLLWLDVRRREDLSWHLWTVVLWVALVGSRPVSTWFDYGAGYGSVAQNYDEGNPLERLVYFVFMLHALIVVVSRQVRLAEFSRANGWLAAFFAYWAISILWADLPLVALKRWSKDIGNVLMVLLVLTEKDPLSATKAVFIRCAALLIPLSLLFIRFYPDLGRTYHVASGEMMYTGITTHKNSLGTLTLVCGMFLTWDFVTRLRGAAAATGWASRLADASLWVMTLWLLYEAHSATALACGLAAGAILVLLASEWVRRHIRRVELLGLVLVLCAWALNSTFNVAEWIVVDLMGRDLTLTTRTDVWPMLIGMNDNVFFGEGFSSFWSGARLDAIYEQLSIIQAHNGYLDTYLNGGLVGVTLMALLLMSTVLAINRDVEQGDEFSAVRFACLAVVLVSNLTESSFNKMGLLWFAFLLVVVRYPGTSATQVSLASPAPQAPPTRRRFERQEER
jgi:exopolysaccharide production protein ExoQ